MDFLNGENGKGGISAEELPVDFPKVNLKTKDKYPGPASGLPKRIKEKGGIGVGKLPADFPKG